MSLFGWVFVAAIAWALLSGKTQFGSRQISRREHPLGYWCTLLVMAVLAGLLFAWGPVR